MKAAWGWLKKAGVWIAGVLLLVVGAGWLWRRHRTELGRIKDELAVTSATKVISRLRAVRAEVAAQVGEDDQAVRELDQQLANNHRRLVEAHENGQGLSDEEVEAAYARLGL